MSTDTSHLQCLCNTVHEPASLLLATTLPATFAPCHCNICRRTSGCLFVTFLELTGRPSSIEHCTLYNPMKEGRVEHYFCSTCGSRTFDHALRNDKWWVCAGLVELRNPSGGNVTSSPSHRYVADTKDGGFATVLRQLSGREVPCYANDAVGSAMSSSQLDELKASSSQQREGRLRASCHCESITFDILPVSASADKVQNPAVARWLRTAGTKYLALNCACRYCRRACGFTFASNAYVLPENIVDVTDQKPIFDYSSQDSTTSDFMTSTPALQKKFPRLKFDFTSPGIRRSFCGVCGASVFFERATRPQCVNVAVGILRARSGALAKEWIDFDWEVCWKEQAVDNDVVRAFEAQMQR